jgi:hypothetical protein
LERKQVEVCRNVRITGEYNTIDTVGENPKIFSFLGGDHPLKNARERSY